MPYKKADKIESLEGFLAHYARGFPVYNNHKYMAPGFIEHWSLIQIKKAIKYGSLFYSKWTESK